MVMYNLFGLSDNMKICFFLIFPTELVLHVNLLLDDRRLQSSALQLASIYYSGNYILN